MPQKPLKELHDWCLPCSHLMKHSSLLSNPAETPSCLIDEPTLFYPCSIRLQVRFENKLAVAMDGL